MIQHVYIAGAITGNPNYLADFSNAASDLRARGIMVTNPCELDSPEEAAQALSDPYGEKYEELLARDLRIIEGDEIDAVVVLPGWSVSKGANREVAKARELGKPVLSYPDLRPLCTCHGWNPLVEWCESCPHAGTEGLALTATLPDAEKVIEVRIWRPSDGYPLPPIDGHTLPTGSAERKAVPLASGVLDYFPAALAAVAEVSKAGNDKHNPGQPMHHARGKSGDHADCILRHLVDRGSVDPEDGHRHSAKVAWRALALLQEELEAAGAPLARGAKSP